MRTKTVMLLGTLSLAAAQDRLPISGEATAALQKPGERDPSSGAAPQALAGVYIRAGQFERALETLERAAALDPSNKSTQHLLATCYLEQAMNPRLSAPDAQVYLERSAAAEDRALAVDPSFFDALAHKSRVLRELAARETRPANRQTLIAEANALAARATSIAAGSPMSIPPGNESNPSFFPPPPPPPPAPGAADLHWVYAETSFVASGDNQPEKIKDIRPVYPPMAIRLGVQGTVVVEASVDRQGQVVDVRIIDSVPLLNQSTIDAVKQWRFDPATVTAAGNRMLVTIKATFIPAE